MAVEFYRYSYRTAEHDGDVEEYRASRDENRRCTEFIQHPQTGLYANAYKDNVVDKDGTYLDKCISEFGMQRMMFVIANTVKMSKHDGRWSPEVRHKKPEHMRPMLVKFPLSRSFGICKAQALLHPAITTEQKFHGALGLRVKKEQIFCKKRRKRS